MEISFGKGYLEQNRHMSPDNTQTHVVRYLESPLAPGLRGNTVEFLVVVADCPDVLKLEAGVMYDSLEIECSAYMKGYDVKLTAKSIKAKRQDASK